MTPLDVPMQKNDAGAKTVREYLIKLLEKLFDEDEGFSGKRPFGNSGWQRDVQIALVKAGYVDGSFDEDGYLEDFDEVMYRGMLKHCFRELRGPRKRGGP